MATRYDILSTLKTDIEEKFKDVDKYDTKLYEVKIGIVNPNKFTTRPAIGLWCYEDNVMDQQMDGEPLRNLKCMIYGYIDTTEDYDDYEELFTFARETEQFLYSTDNTYVDNVLIMSTQTNFGGVTPHVGYFIIFFDINYYQTDF